MILRLCRPWIDKLWLFFLRNTVQTQTLTYTCTHSPLWTHTRTPYPYEHLRETEPAGRVLRLTKSPQAPRCRRERRLPLKNIPPKWETPVPNLGFELWWAGGTTTLLTILPQAGSLLIVCLCRYAWLKDICLFQFWCGLVPNVYQKIHLRSSLVQKILCHFLILWHSLFELSILSFPCCSTINICLFRFLYFLYFRPHFLDAFGGQESLL